MKLQNIHTDDVLASLGLQTRRSPLDYLFPALGIFGFGILVGAGMGLLFAPKAGAELRQQISDRMRRRRTADMTPGETESEGTDEERQAAE